MEALQEMGYSEQAVLSALQRADGNVPAAIELLLSDTPEPPQPMPQATELAVGETVMLLALPHRLC